MTPETPPLVSVIMPAYNVERYIGKSIASVMGQTYPRIELIVIDDGSSDGTLDVIRQYGQAVRCLTQERLGCPAARNTGIRASAGELVAFLDADDLWPESAVADLAAPFLCDPGIGMTFGITQYMDPETEHLTGRHLRELPASLSRTPIAGLDAAWRIEGPILEELLQGILFSCIAVMVRREWLERVGLFDVRLRRAQDRDLWYKLAAAGCPMAYVEKTVGWYRKHRSKPAENLMLLRNTESRAGAFQNVVANPLVRDERIRRMARARLAGLYSDLGDFHFAAGRYAEARRNYAIARTHHPRPGQVIRIALTALGPVGYRILPRIARRNDAHWRLLEDSVAQEKMEAKTPS